jgi:YD repeat-containing protein
MLRPTLVASDDLTGSTAYTTYLKSTYDPLGRAIFTSQPSTTPSPSQGVDTTYDALGRVTQAQETISPYATTTTEYLAGNKIKVTDAAGGITTTTHRAFGSPSTDEVMQVIDATGTTTSMTRDIYGNIQTLNQSSGLNGYTVNVTREFWYDSRLRLCRHRAPEFGDEMFRYDNANRMLMTWRGASQASSCNGVPHEERIVYYYDTMDRVTRLDYRWFPYDIFNTYDANGNVLTTNRLGANWTYTYNELDQITSEGLVIDGRTYTTQHLYDANGNNSAIVNPTGIQYNFNPDGFGRKQQLKMNGPTNPTYVSGINYHVSGQVSSANFANGQGLVQSLNARLSVVI